MRVSSNELFSTLKNTLSSTGPGWTQWLGGFSSASVQAVGRVGGSCNGQRTWFWDRVRHSRMLSWSQKTILARRFDALRHHQLANCNGNKLDSYWYRRTGWGFGVKGGDVNSAKMLHVTRVKNGLPGHNKVNAWKVVRVRSYGRKPVPSSSCLRFSSGLRDFIAIASSTWRRSSFRWSNKTEKLILGVCFGCCAS